MKRLKSVELFLALGLAATVGACGNPASNTTQGGEAAEPASNTDHGGESANSPAVTAPMSHSEGGEGGEGGESASTGDSDVDYMTTLGLMRGHLLVAKELMAQGKYDEAQPHIAHPVDELYSAIETQLTQRNVPDFKSTLNQLNDLIKSAPDSAQTTAAYDAAMESIDQAIAALPASQRQSPDFVLNVINHLLRTAAEEYQAAIAENKIVEIVEYQDSRGFVLYANELYQTIAAQMQQQKPDQHTVIVDSFKELKTAWPDVNPPATPIKTPSEISSLASQIELQ